MLIKNANLFKSVMLNLDFVDFTETLLFYRGFRETTVFKFHAKLSLCNAVAHSLPVSYTHLTLPTIYSV